MAKNLVLFGYSGFNSSQTKSIIKILSELEDPALVLIEDGVIGSTSTTNIPYQTILDKGIQMLCVSEDVEARGLKIEDIHPNIKQIHYQDVIDLIETSDRIISWL
jgi:sulfur relay protein TusB/DsrH